MSGPGPFGQYAAILAQAFYEPIPITLPSDRASWLLAPGKQPAMKAWQNGCPQKDWHRYAHCGLGLLTRRLPVVDIDVLDQSLAEDLSRLLDRGLGEAPVKVGQAPKRSHLFQCDQPFAKSKLTFVWRDLPCGIEILADGQQTVCYGQHPGTGAPYEWLREPVHQLPRGLLPILDADAASWLMRELARVLGTKMGAQDVRLTGQASEDVADVDPKVVPLRAMAGSRHKVTSGHVYAEATLAGVCADIRSAPDGAQETTLNAGCWKIGALVAAGHLGERQAFNELLDAALAMPSYDERRKWSAHALRTKVQRSMVAGVAVGGRA